jgi:ribonucleotide reductase beta subunit family protein with ferritin-like domain
MENQLFAENKMGSSDTTNAPDDSVEYLLRENPNRFVIFPIKHADIWEAFQNHRKAFWVESEVDLQPDLKDWAKLKDGEKHFIKMVLAFFAASDGIIMENLGLRFFSEVQIPEARLFYSIQMLMESTHSIMYSQLIDTYISNNVEKQNLFQAIETIPSVKKKSNWAMKWIDSSDNFATRLIAFAAVEGIFFSGSFCCIYWLNESGKMPGLCKSNDFIARDEGMHTDFACLLYKNYINKKLTDEQVHAIIATAVEIEIEFITESLPCNLLGMNATMMEQYIKYVSNRLLSQLGHTELFPGVKQPFSFMDRICLEGKTNFFEARVTEYQMEVNSVGLDKLNFGGDF